MFYQNVGTPVRSSAAYVVGFGFILLIAGMGYSVHQYRKANAPPQVVVAPPPASMSQQVPGDSALAPIKVESGHWQHVMLLPKERKFLRIDVNTHVEVIGKGVRVLDICADKQARAPRQCPAASPAQQVNIENERDETNIILVQAFS